MQVGTETHPGRVRKTNEDALHAGRSLLAVADGLGGYAAGEIASSLAIETLAGWRSWSDPQTALQNAFHKANQTVLHRAMTDEKCAGMGTTLTAAYIKNGKLYAAHVGDSRLYLCRNGNLESLTEDHSIVNELVKGGDLTKAEAQFHPQRNILTRALGMGPDVLVDYHQISLQPDDRLLLCTDGLYNMVTESRILTMLISKATARQIAANLTAAANVEGGHDNITVIVAFITGEDLT
jgi:serine/threonine protein phosphatase PrpC